MFIGIPGVGFNAEESGEDGYIRHGAGNQQAGGKKPQHLEIIAAAAMNFRLLYVRNTCQ